jgi:hypothetical protein
MVERQIIQRNPYGKLTRADLFAHEVDLLNEFRRRGFGKMLVHFANGLPVYSEQAIESLKFGDCQSTEPIPPR